QNTRCLASNPHRGLGAGKATLCCASPAIPHAATVPSTNPNSIGSTASEVVGATAYRHRVTFAALRLARSASLMRKGLSEAQVEAALGDLERADLPAKTVAALRLVDLLSAPQPMIDTAIYQRLREHLDDRELLELGAALSVASGWQRFIEAFGIRPDSWTEAMPLPWHAGTL